MLHAIFKVKVCNHWQFNYSAHKCYLVQSRRKFVDLNGFEVTEVKRAVKAIQNTVQALGFVAERNLSQVFFHFSFTYKWVQCDNVNNNFSFAAVFRLDISMRK